MRGNAILDALSRRAPEMVIATLAAALLVYWAEAPVWLPYGLALVVVGLALVVMAARDRRGRFTREDDPDASSDTSWIAQELAGKGTASGSYLLGFFSLVTIMLTGFQGAYALPGWAALALTAAWGIANARRPNNDGSER